MNHSREVAVGRGLLLCISAFSPQGDCGMDTHIHFFGGKEEMKAFNVDLFWL